MATSYTNEPASEKNHEGETKSLEAQILPWILGFGAFIIFVVCAFRSGGKESFWTSALFALPVFAQVIGSAILWHRVNVNSKRGNIVYYRLNLYATSACIASYCSLWVLYSVAIGSNSWLSYPNVLQSFSYLALALICVLLFLVAIMTSAFIMTSNNVKPTRWLTRQCEAVRFGIKDEPLWAIALFFILFLGVAYLFGFALAFHDQYALTFADPKDPKVHMPALRMVNLKSIDDIEPSANSTESNAGNNKVEQSQSNIVAGETRDPKDNNAKPQTATEQSVAEAGEANNEFYFYFKDAEAYLRKQPYDRCGDPASPPKRTDKNFLDRREEFNHCSLQAIADRIRKVTGNDKRVRIFLIGHSSNEPIGQSSKSKSYFSNYELSEARTQNVRYEILHMFPDVEVWHNIEWSILPASDEPLPLVAHGLEGLFNSQEMGKKFKQEELKKITQADIESRFTPEEIDKKLLPEEKRVVIAVIKPIPEHVTTLQMSQLRQDQNKDQFKPLKLIDYMYFSIYTITTTGYGDIVPTTAYAKFVTSLANVCEVLFLVVFFNALVSIKGDKREDEMLRRIDDLEAQAKNERDAYSQSTNVKTGDFGK